MVCVGWYSWISVTFGVNWSLYLLGINTQTLQKGLWAPGVCIFETKSCPAGPGVLLFLENLDKEVVLGLTKSLSGSFSCSFISLCTGCQGALDKWGFPRWFALGNTLSNSESCSLPLGHVPALLWNTQRSAWSLWGGNILPCSQGLLESPRLWEWDWGWLQQPTGSEAGAPTVHYPTSHSCRCWVIST